jgi:hypothetical protein
LTEESTQLSSGLALAPHLAAQCVLDEKRTAAFQRGTASAIAAARARFPGETIEVVYAGTGPFAPLVLPLLPMPDVRCTFIDVDERSLNILRAMHPPARIVHADATQYAHDARLHVVVSETMQRSLAVEPFVAILHNLRAQLAPGGFFVPERVTVDAVLIDPEREQARWNGGEGASYVPLARVIDTAKKLDPVFVTIPPTNAPQWLALATEIDVFAGERLRAYDSGLTIPEILWQHSPPRAGAEIEFRYERGERPGIMVALAR